MSDAVAIEDVAEGTDTLQYAILLGTLSLGTGKAFALDFDLVAGQGGHEVGYKASGHRGGIDVIVLHECKQNSLALANLEDLDTFGAVTLQPGSFLFSGNVRKTFLEASDEPLEDGGRFLRPAPEISLSS